MHRPLSCILIATIVLVANAVAAPPTKLRSRPIAKPADKSVTGWEPLITDQESFGSTWTRGSEGGTQSYNADTNILSVDQPYWGHPGPFEYGLIHAPGEWEGFYCQVLAPSLNKQSFEMYVNDERFSLGEFVAKAPGGKAMIKLTYDPEQNRAEVFVNDMSRGVVSNLGAGWNQEFRCSFKATGYQQGKVSFGQFRVLRDKE
jgi:hypothetical protein